MFRDRGYRHDRFLRLKEEAAMDTTDQLQAAIDVLASLEIEVRQEYLGGDSGGMCKLRGKRVVFVDLDADAATRLERCADVLRGLSDLETVYLPPHLREMLDRPEA